MTRHAFCTYLMLVGTTLVILPACSSVKDDEQAAVSSLKIELAKLNDSEPILAFDENAVPAEIASFCGDCHVLPRSGSFAREVWYDEILKGYEFYARSGRDDLKPPPLQTVLDFYRQRAPEEIQFPLPKPVDDRWRSRFRVEEIRWDGGPGMSPAISSLRWIEFSPDQERRLIATDMRDGTINAITAHATGSSRQLIARVDNPARANPCDLNNDGWTDLVVADLGSFSPYDHGLGRVVWLKRDPSSKEFTAETISQQLGRIADVTAGDFNGDSAQDLLVAEFGHRQSGSIRLLLNEPQVDANTSLESTLQFREQVLDGRPGTIQVPTYDWDKDGRLDFAAVISQEIEAVELFLNRSSKFDQYRVSSGSDLTYGSVGIELTDLDQDGDQDIIYVNGDTFDNNFANRSHGIQWLENKGNLSFESHRLIDLPGAYRAVAADIDNDDDLDIVAVANLPTTVYPVSLNEQNPASIILLEQTEPLKFEERVLERGTPRYPSLEAADFDGDGKVDIAVGALLFDTDPPNSPSAALPQVAIWWQQ